MSAQQSFSLLKKQLFQLSHELQLQKIQNQNYLTQIVELKQKQTKLKQINNLLAQNLNKSEKQVNDQITLKIEGQFLTKRIQQLEEELEKYRTGVSDSVDRRVKKIVTQFTQDQQIQLQKRKSRLSLGLKDQFSRKTFLNQNHEHTHYNISYTNCQNTNPDSLKNFKKLYRNNSNPIQSGQGSNFQQSVCTPYQINIHNKTVCEKCLQASQLLEQKQQIIKNLQNKLKALFVQYKQKQRNQNQSSNQSQLNQWKHRYQNLLGLYQNLREQHDLALDQFNKYSSNKKANIQNYTINKSPIDGFKKKQLFQVQSNNGPLNSNAAQSRFVQRDQKDRQQQMLQEITNLVNGLGRNKKQNNQYNNDRSVSPQIIGDKKSRLSYTNSNKSRISQQSSKIDGSFFTIKEGVNRYNTQNNFF